MGDSRGASLCKLATVALAAGLAALPATAAPAASAAIAYTIEPLNGVNTTPRLFAGTVCETYRCVKVPTPAALDPSHLDGVFGEDGPIADGAASLDAALIDDPGEKLVFGFSQGAQVGGFWLRNYAPATTVEPETTSFLFVGDPENTYGVPWAPRVPTDSGFAVTELWAQYDGWADWPDRFDLLAIANAVYGMLFVHPTVYDEMDLAAQEAAGNVVTWEADAVTYKMVLQPEVPMLEPLRNLGLGWVADFVNDGLRAHIEEQYDRPATQEEADALYGQPEVEASTAPLVESADTVEPVDPLATVEPETATPVTRRADPVTDDLTEMEDSADDETEIDSASPLDAGDDTAEPTADSEATDGGAESTIDDEPGDEDREPRRTYDRYTEAAEAAKATDRDTDTSADGDDI